MIGPCLQERGRAWNAQAAGIARHAATLGGFQVPQEVLALMQSTKGDTVKA